jgi:hypothetical protein
MRAEYIERQADANSADLLEVNSVDLLVFMRLTMQVSVRSANFRSSLHNKERKARETVSIAGKGQPHTSCHAAQVLAANNNVLRPVDKLNLI